MSKSYDPNPDEAPGNFYVDRSRWLDYLAERRDVTHGEFRVAYFIASKINPDDRSMWWNVMKIAKVLGVSSATVSASTRKLEHLGLMVITKGAKGSKRYSFRMPFDPETAARQNKPQKRAGNRRKSRTRILETKNE